MKGRESPHPHPPRLYISSLFGAKLASRGAGACRIRFGRRADGPDAAGGGRLGVLVLACQMQVRLVAEPYLVTTRPPVQK